jgi:hypothetical protein
MKKISLQPSVPTERDWGVIQKNDLDLLASYDVFLRKVLFRSSGEVFQGSYSNDRRASLDAVEAIRFLLSLFVRIDDETSAKFVGGARFG